MRCYYTGEECDCGGDMETECPHDDMTFDDVLDDASDVMSVERQFSELSEQLEVRLCPVTCYGG